MADIQSKTCTGCGSQKAMSEYIARTDNPGKYQSRCKACVSEYMRARYLAARAGVILRAKEWYAGNRDRALKTAAAWRKANPEKRREQAYRRRSLVDGLTVTREQIQQRFAFFGGLCWMCGEVADTVDHVKPLSRGGAHMASNLRPACRPCNSRKRDRWDGVSLLSRFINLP